MPQTGRLQRCCQGSRWPVPSTVPHKVAHVRCAAPTALLCHCSCLTPSLCGFQALGLTLPRDGKASLSRSGFCPDPHNGHESSGRGQALPDDVQDTGQSLRSAQNSVGSLLHRSATFLSRKPWEDQVCFQTVISALHGQDRKVGKEGVPVSEQERPEESLQIYCSLADSILSAGSVFVSEYEQG